MKSNGIKVLAFFAILAFGFAKLLPEEKLANDERAAHFHQAQLTVKLRDQIGQTSFLAALSGFRAAVADMLWLEAYTAFANVQWGKMEQLLQDVTTLQPRSVMFWNMAAWHMAYNASVSALNNPNQPRKALRIKAQREYFDIGKDFLLRGIANNPDHYLLYESLANLYDAKYHDHCKAAQYFKKAAAFPDSPTYEKRFAAYQLAACPGHEREAYEELLRLYKMGKSERFPTLVKLLNQLGKKLNVPPPENGYSAPPKLKH